MGNCHQPQGASDEIIRHHSSINRHHPERNPSATSRLAAIEGQLKSDIVMEVCVHTLMPSIRDTLVKSYSLTYKIEYARLMGKWTEAQISQQSHKSKYLALEYIYGATKQEVNHDTFIWNIGHRRHQCKCRAGKWGFKVKKAIVQGSSLDLAPENPVSLRFASGNQGPRTYRAVSYNT